MWIIWTVALIATWAIFGEAVKKAKIDCDFETPDICGYTVEKNNTPGLFDVMEWRRGEAVEKMKYYDIKLLTFGPDEDHTNEATDGNFMYAVRPINPNTITTLVSPTASGRICYFEFFYHMGSSSLNTMTAYVIKYGDRIKLWSASGQQGMDWNRALIDIEKYTEFGSYQIAIEVNEPNDAYWTVGYAVDDIKGVGCNLPIDCDFEVDLCNFEVQLNDSMFGPMEWTSGKPRTKTWFGMVDTLRYGPSQDHTTGNRNGHFAYAQKSYASNSATGLVSPRQLDQLCYASFWYYMNVTSLKTLSFHIRKEGYDFLIWNVTGDQGQRWNYVEVEIEDLTKYGSYDLVWWATEPGDKYWSVGYALDDIKTYGCECDSFPCLNGGQCFNAFENYTCLCPQYWEGQNCEIDTNPCTTDPCRNLASCNPHKEDYTCNCWPGWTGKNCDVNVDDCASSPCKRGGTCIDELNDFTCTCPAGYEGKTCDTEIDECESSPCQNAATCTDGLASYSCSCRPGFTGQDCEHNIDECASDPCQHDGYCLNLINMYFCICYPEYAGYNCEIRKEMDCDFEVDFCGYTVTTDDTDVDDNNETLVWTDGFVSEPGFFGNSRIIFQGPRVDHTTGETDGKAAYVQEGESENATTTMMSPILEGRLCYLEFFYHMGSSDLNDLDVFIIKDGKENHLFNAHGYQGFEWQRAMLDIEEYTETGQYQLAFRADEPKHKSGNTLKAGYVIDDIKGFNCDLSIDCDFENDTCNYIIERDNDYFDRMEWRRGQAQLETVFFNIKLLRNGPPTDHTTDLNSGHFMYAVKPINAGTNTTLVAPRQRDQMCFLRFYYHMGSHYLNDLIVYIRAENETYTVFNVTSYQGDDWNEALIDISEETKEGKYEIAIFVNEPSDQVWTVGYAIDDISASECMCNVGPCLNGGTCINEYKDYKCMCPYLFSGKDCENRIDPCDYAPCGNGGTCKNGAKNKYSFTSGNGQKIHNTYSCLCPDGWTGENCTQEVNECESNPCYNYATCNDLFNGFSCDCAPGWYGELCDQNVDECLSQPCQNKATCRDEINFYECECLPGYYGVYCQFDIDECASNPCINGGTCVDDVNFYSCQCPPGYTGTNCEVEIDECASYPCQNQGLCMDRIARFDCYCRPGFTGSTCQRDVDECWSQPCMNGGTCNDHINFHTCTCAVGYTGQECEVEIDECDSDPCRNGGTCHDEVGRFNCKCPIHWAGDVCEKSLTDCGLDPC